MESGAEQEKNLAPQGSRRDHSADQHVGSGAPVVGGTVLPHCPALLMTLGPATPSPLQDWSPVWGFCALGSAPPQPLGLPCRWAHTVTKALVSGLLFLGSWVWVQRRHLVIEFISSSPLLLFSSPGTSSLLTQPKGIQDSGPQWAWVWATSPESFQQTPGGRFPRCSSPAQGVGRGRLPPPRPRVLPPIQVGPLCRSQP
ncbi:hypothetical protein HJG60_009626 [Phyllostomus discolor]|uniref:Uncharacterized protein n=1 Tax=Phyllostomus discolor TaxID=89673 RepID=A0A833YHS7_9CHIR|nr:hypothetical protein HJG60_009626 [Phyllostomus discolor]